MNYYNRHQARIALVNQHVAEVAELLPFPVEVTADMGGTFALYIDLGRRDDGYDTHDTAGIDPNPRNGPLVWWFDFASGEETVLSDHGMDTDPTTVARWLTELAHLYQSPVTYNRP